MAVPRIYNHRLICDLATLYPEWTYGQIADAHARKEGKRPSDKTVQWVLIRAGLTQRERMQVADVDITALQDKCARLESETSNLRKQLDAERRKREAIEAETANTRRAARRALSDAEKVTGHDPRRLLELIGAIVWAEQDESDYDATIACGTYLGALCEIPLRACDVEAIRDGRGIVAQKVDRHYVLAWEAQGGQTACKKRLKAQGVTGRDTLVTRAEIERDGWIATQVDACRWPWGQSWY